MVPRRVGVAEMEAEVGAGTSCRDSRWMLVYGGGDLAGTGEVVSERMKVCGLDEATVLILPRGEAAAGGVKRGKGNAPPVPPVPLLYHLPTPAPHPPPLLLLYSPSVSVSVSSEVAPVVRDTDLGFAEREKRRTVSRPWSFEAKWTFLGVDG